jgi:hypothetical protein
MRVTLDKNDVYEVVAEIKPIPSMKKYELNIMSYFKGAAHPEWRTHCKVITSKNNLRCLMFSLACEVVECEC